MTSFIFCLIFIQVGIFLIAAGILATSVIMGFLHPEPSTSTEYRRSQKAIYTPEPLSRNEIEYLLGS